MKVGQIIAIVVAVGVVAAVYLADRTPSSTAAAESNPQEETQPDTGADLDAKVNEAVEIIQTGSQPPMVAVQLLREVIAVDSNHIGANYWLGEFSMMSGQYDKAVARFAKLCALQPDNVEACIKLARAQYAAGNLTQAQEVLNNFVTTHPDEHIREQIAPVLEELSN